MTASEIAKALGGKRSGNEWLCHCPAHTDKRSSLSITESNGKTLLHCHAGCSQLAVIDALKSRGLWAVQGSKPKIIKEYNYTDLEGKLLFQVVRYNDKTFKQRQPDGRGGWIWNLRGVPRVLYRFPDLMKAVKEKKVIFIAEGERDIETLVKHGLPATCNPGGAGKWREEYTQTLKGARVIIIPDNDRAGKKHAQAVAHALHKSGSKVKILELPGLPDKGDVSDWLNNGGTIADLMNLVKNTCEWDPTQVKPSKTFKDSRNKDLYKLAVKLRIKDLTKEYVIVSVSYTHL
ncbi:MAG TPA: hypothetical protein ENH82_20090, partial [bacterium]|nr:hypothetical protein [bacterium]